MQTDGKDCVQCCGSHSWYMLRDMCQATSPPKAGVTQVNFGLMQSITSDLEALAGLFDKAL